MALVYAKNRLRKFLLRVSVASSPAGFVPQHPLKYKNLIAIYAKSSLTDQYAMHLQVKKIMCHLWCIDSATYVELAGETAC